MKRITVTVPDGLAEDLETLSTELGVSRSAFLSAYLSKRVEHLAAVAVEYNGLTVDDVGKPIRNRGVSSPQVVELAEGIVAFSEAKRRARKK